MSYLRQFANNIGSKFTLPHSENKHKNLGNLNFSEIWDQIFEQVNHVQLSNFEIQKYSI